MLIATFAPILTPIFDMIHAITIGICIATSLTIVRVVLPTSFAVITDTFYIMGIVVPCIFFAVITPRSTIFT
jgi:hypothetical protein